MSRQGRALRQPRFVGIRLEPPATTGLVVDDRDLRPAFSNILRYDGPMTFVVWNDVAFASASGA